MLLVITAPLGAGRNVLRLSVQERLPGTRISISCTTRQPRTGEIPGQDFTFLTQEQFQSRIDQGQFLEWSQINDNRFGTPRSPLLEDLAAGHDVVMTSDTVGAEAIKRAVPDAVRAFLCPGTWEELAAQMRAQMPSAARNMPAALERAREDLKRGQGFDYVVLGSNVATLTQHLCAIIQGEKWRTSRHGDHLARLINAPLPVQPSISVKMQ